MRRLPFLFALATATAASGMEPGRWDIRSTVVELAVPGLPGFVQRMARGRSSAEHKRLDAGQGAAALLAPDPKARCTVESQTVADGRYAQALTCPGNKGVPMHVARAGTFDEAGFAGRATVTGSTPKGPFSITLDQRALRVGG